MASWSIRRLSQTADFRLDAEYYLPKYLDLMTSLADAGAVQVDTIATVTDGIHASPEWVEDGGVSYLSAMCVKDNYINLSNAGQISTEQNLRNPRTQARLGDILITSVGTIGNAAVVEDDILPANMDRHIAIVRLRSKSDDVDPYYVSTFFNSQLGRLQTYREATGNVQLNLYVDKIRRLLIPVGRRFQRISELTREAYAHRRESTLKYQAAEQMFASEIGLQRLSKSHSNMYVGTIGEATTARRWDAEFFNPKYREAIKLLERSGQKLSDVAQLAKRRFKPNLVSTFDYVEIGNINSAGHATSETLNGAEAPSRAQWTLQEGDVITSTVRPIRRLSALIDADQSGYVCSSGFAVLSPTAIASELLLVYLRLPIVCEILDLYATASMYPAISSTDLLEMPITLPSAGVGKEIVRNVKASRQAYLEASRMLEEATSLVVREVLGDGHSR